MLYLRVKKYRALQPTCCSKYKGVAGKGEGFASTKVFIGGSFHSFKHPNIRYNLHCAQFKYLNLRGLTILGFLIFVSCNSHSNLEDKNLAKDNKCFVTDSTTISIVNRIIIEFKSLDNRYQTKVLVDNNFPPRSIEDYRGTLMEVSKLGFNVSDSLYMIKKVQDEISCVYNPKTINALIIPSDTIINWIKYRIDIWKRFRERYKSGIMIIDKPLINKNKNEAFIRIDYSIGGLEGIVELWVYRLNKNKWRKYKLIRHINS